MNKKNGQLLGISTKNLINSASSSIDIDPDLIDGLLDNSFESILLVDANGIVRFVNNSYLQVYARKRADMLGRYIIDVAPESLLPEVLKTGKVIMGRSRVLEDKSQIVVRVPLRKNGKLIGAIAKVIFIPPESLQNFARKITAMEKELEAYKGEFKSIYTSRYTFEHIIGETDAMIRAKNLAKACAKTSSAVLILGESGSGKELFAQAIHSASRRRKEPFVSVNCTAVPNELIESELFGYEAGSFTGALAKGKKGKFELADKGTIHLDEIGDMPYLMQSKLLRVIQEGEIEKIRQPKPKRLNFRLICATNKFLEAMVEKGTIRMDLFYRINVVAISVPSLREIPDDIPKMVNHSLGRLKQERNQPIEAVSDRVIDIFKQYHWPGNVRELKNVLERATVVCSGACIEVEDLPPSMLQTSSETLLNAQSLRPIKEVVQSAEKQAIIDMLRFTKNNKNATAKLLGIHRTSLYQKLSKYGISL